MIFEKLATILDIFYFDQIAARMNSNHIRNFKKHSSEADLLSCVIGCTPIKLEEAHLTEIRSLIAQFPTDLQKPASNEKNLERFQKLLELYGIEPHLLDSILAELVDALVQHITWEKQKPYTELDQLSKSSLVRLKVLSAVRGYKFLMRFLPHNLEMLEPVLTSLEYLANTLAIAPSPIPTGPILSMYFIDKQILHILVVWLMIICKNPFCLTRHQQKQLDEPTGPTKSITQRIIDCMDTFLNKLTMDGGLKVVPYLLAQILTRNPNNMSSLAPRFERFYRVFHEFQSELDGGKQLINQLTFANALLKIGKRHEIRPFAEQLLRTLTPSFVSVNCQNILVRDLIAKLLQRIALVLLRPKLAPWRYSCGHRSLEDNLRPHQDEKNISEEESSNFLNEQIDEQEIDADIPYDQVEMLIGELILKIRDRDNMVRWTAAKGVARICARIPLEMAAEVVSSIMKDSFPSEDAKMEKGSSSWMGGCLTLAELCRRGCLLPEQVPKVISLVLRNALVFEQTHQAFMLAVNVRDAACYICWAFSRAYEASLLRQHLRPLAGTLLSVALFDREVNVRRAASAAFQENVGRNDSFPHGIPILQIVNYVEVARIRHCYLELSVQIAQFPKYIRPMLQHLCSLKLRHWDEAIRELAAQALHRLAPFDMEYSYNELLPKLCLRIRSSKNPAEKHGAFFAVSAFLETLCGKYNVHIHRDQLLFAISEHTSTLGNHRTAGFSLIGKSLCRLIQAMCTVGYELDDKELAQFHDILDLVVGDQNAKMAEWAAQAFSALMAYYKGSRFPLLLARMKNKYFPEIDRPSQNESTRCSSIIPLGYLHAEFLLVKNPFEEENAKETKKRSTLGQILIRKLIDVVYDVNTPKWVFARVAAIETIYKLLMIADQISHLVGLPDLIRCFCQAADDYTATTNGNIGRFARRAAILAMEKLLPLAYEKSNPAIEQHGQLLDLAIGKIAERACESIDDLREKASIALAHLIDLGAEHPLCRQISEFDLLRRIFLITTSANSTTNILAHTAPWDVTEKEKGIIASEEEVMNGNGEGGVGVDEFHLIDWRQSSGFGRLSALLGSPKYGLNALTGFVLSTGSVCGWTRENAFLAIVNYLKPHKQDIQFLDQFLARLRTVYKIISTRQNDTSPVLILFRMLLNDGQLHSLERLLNPSADSPAFGQLCELTIQLAAGKCKSKVKLEAITVLGSLLQLNPNSQLYRRVLQLLLSLLDSPYVALREKAVEQLFDAFSLIGGEDELEERPINEVLSLLSQTDWSAPGNAKIEFSQTKEKITKLLIPTKNND